MVVGINGMIIYAVVSFYKHSKLKKFITTQNDKLKHRKISWEIEKKYLHLCTNYP